MIDMSGFSSFGDITEHDALAVALARMSADSFRRWRVARMEMKRSDPAIKFGKPFLPGTVFRDNPPARWQQAFSVVTFPVKLTDRSRPNKPDRTILRTMWSEPDDNGWCQCTKAWYCTPTKCAAPYSVICECSKPINQHRQMMGDLL